MARLLLLAVPVAAQQAIPIPLPPPIWNNKEAMLRLGSRYSHGEGVPQDYGQALRYYQRAAELGSLMAADNLGTYYATGRGVPVDKGQALSWYRRAALGGFVPAMNNVAVLYSLGAAGKPDHCQAFTWFKKSAEGGNATGMRNLGLYYQKGWCPQARNAKLARQWLQNAVDIGSQPTATAPDKLAAAQAAQTLREL